MSVDKGLIGVLALLLIFMLHCLCGCRVLMSSQKWYSLQLNIFIGVFV